MKLITLNQRRQLFKGHIMARTALEEWERLNGTINCKHYIGPRSHKVICDALEGLEKPAVVKPVVKKAPIKKAD